MEVAQVLKKSAVKTFVLVSAFTIVLFAQVTTRRVQLRAMDTDHNPIPGVKITITSPDIRTFKKEFFTDKRGQIAFILPMEITIAHFLLEKEGYQNQQESVELIKMRDSQEALLYQRAFMLYRTNQLTPEQMAKKDEAYQTALAFLNKGIELFQSEKFAEAAKQFEKAAEAKTDFVEAFENLAASYFRLKLFDKAIEAAKSALNIDANSSQALRIISVAYSSLGDEATALEYMYKLKQLPDEQLSAEELYNMAVAAANKGADEEAKGYFERSIQRKPDFALGHFQLGLCYLRLNLLEKAKIELEKYLAIEPDGENAQTAKTILDRLNKNGLH
jgi:tetratricopeptide (TPR) repeat protein